MSSNLMQAGQYTRARGFTRISVAMWFCRNQHINLAFLYNVEPGARRPDAGAGPAPQNARCGTEPTGLPVMVKSTSDHEAAAKKKPKAARVEIPVDAVMIRQITRAKKVAVAQVTSNFQEPHHSDMLTPEQAKADVDALDDDDVADFEPTVVPALAGNVSEASDNIEVTAKTIEKAPKPKPKAATGGEEDSWRRRQLASHNPSPAMGLNSPVTDWPKLDGNDDSSTVPSQGRAVAAR
ncbi:hypothetical protein ON010_g10424 [Phytophthora cinnamomi]|nr:hypothetical protein ON010_g10424 [Phytophthora cinnamomi]